jgi:hypothetical protein
LARRLGEPQSLSGRGGNEKYHHDPYREFKSPAVHPIALNLFFGNIIIAMTTKAVCIRDYTVLEAKSSDTKTIYWFLGSIAEVRSSQRQMKLADENECN